MNSMAGGTGYGELVGPNGQVSNKIPKGYKYGQISQYTPEQKQLFGQQFSQVSPDSFTSKLASGDQSAFNEYETPALRQFNELQGGLASRFSGMGMGSRRSSGFQNTSNQAASNFSQELASKRLGLRNQAIQDLMSMSNQLLGQRPYETYLAKQSHEPSGWGGVFGSALGAGAGFLAGGPAGALTGAELGQKIGSPF